MPIDGPGDSAFDKLTFVIFGGYEILDISRQRREDEKNLHIIYSRQRQKKSSEY